MRNFTVSALAALPRTRSILAALATAAAAAAIDAAADL